MRRPAPRRRVLRLGAAGALITALYGCGFRRQQPLSLGWARVALSGFSARSGVAAELRQVLSGATQVVGEPAAAELVVVALQEQREKSVVALSAGQVREVQLRLKFRYRLLDAQGRERAPPAELVLLRDLSFSEGVALAKEREEMALYREMEADIARQVLRRVAALRP